MRDLRVGESLENNRGRLDVAWDAIVSSRG